MEDTAEWMQRAEEGGDYPPKKTLGSRINSSHSVEIPDSVWHSSNSQITGKHFPM
ncbi:MAG: hypothetical protein AAFX06_22330 [Planctomycetota bacterium]